MLTDYSSVQILYATGSCLWVYALSLSDFQYVCLYEMAADAIYYFKNILLIKVEHSARKGRGCVSYMWQTLYPWCSGDAGEGLQGVFLKRVVNSKRRMVSDNARSTKTFM
jgi:hypothetical protein